MGTLDTELEALCRRRHGAFHTMVASVTGDASLDQSGGLSDDDIGAAQHTRARRPRHGAARR